MSLFHSVFLGTLIGLSGCATVPEAGIVIQELESPGGLHCSEPNLHVSASGAMYLCWVDESDTTAAALKFSGWQGSGWRPSKTIARGNDWFLNWADFPSLTTFGDGNMAAHFLKKSSAGTYSYDVKLVLSNDGGENWGPEILAHNDSTPTEHGFASLLSTADGQLMATWLDGRKYDELDTVTGKTIDQMTLRSALFAADGSMTKATEMDGKVCDCCQTDAVQSGDNIIVVYRDRSDDEVRDIYSVRHSNGKWFAPKAVSNDNWTINGCPVNGPAIDAQGQSVAVAWYTMANDTAKVLLAFSRDGGQSYEDPIQLNQGTTIGRVDVKLAPDGTAWVCWMEEKATSAALKVRGIRSTGELLPSQVITQSVAARKSGFPKLALNGNDLFVAWTDAGGEALTIRTAKLQLPPN